MPTTEALDDSFSIDKYAYLVHTDRTLYVKKVGLQQYYSERWSAQSELKSWKKGERRWYWWRPSKMIGPPH
jgi:hypothetical protein